MSIEKVLEVALIKAAELGIDDIKKQMVELDMNVSLSTSNSLKVNSVSQNQVQIIAEQSILTLVFGRKPGKMPPIAPIKEWADARGLPDGIEWGIAINIGKFGTNIFQGKKKGIDIDRTKKVMIDFFKKEAEKALAIEVSDLLVTLYR